MATTRAGAALAEQHRQAQLRLRARALSDYLALWPTWDGDDNSFVQMAIGAYLLVLTYRRMSAALAAAFYEAFRFAEGVTGRFTPRLAPDVDRGLVVGTLWLVGRDRVRRAPRPAERPAERALRRRLDVPGRSRTPSTGRDDPSDLFDAFSAALRAAEEAALVETSGVVSRLVLDGGRETIVGAVREDPRAVGWARVTDADPCAFCLMLASRGAVYREDTVGFEAHDHCGCSAVPVFHRDDPLPQNERWLEVYNRAIRAARRAGELERGTRNDLLNALRRYLARERAGG